MVLILVIMSLFAVYILFQMYAAWLKPDLYFRLLTWLRGKKTYAPVYGTPEAELWMGKMFSIKGFVGLVMIFLLVVSDR